MIYHQSTLGSYKNSAGFPSGFALRKSLRILIPARCGLEVYDILHPRPQAEGGVWEFFTEGAAEGGVWEFFTEGVAKGEVWEFFTEGLGRNNYTTPNFRGRDDILFKHRV